MTRKTERERRLERALRFVHFNLMILVPGLKDFGKATPNMLRMTLDFIEDALSNPKEDRNEKS